MVGVLLAAAALLGWAAAGRLATQYDLLVFLYALLAGAAGAGAIFLAYHLYGYFSLRYSLDRNALIIRWAGLPDADLDNIERHLAVHVAGSFNTTRARNALDCAASSASSANRPASRVG